MTDVNKSPERIAGMFDAIAGNYDFLNHLLSAGIDKRWRKKAIRSLSLTGRETVLDLCTGTADLALAAIDATPGAARVLGVDFAGAMLRIGLDKTRSRALDSRVTLVRGDASKVPACDRSVDAVTVAFGIRNVQDPRLAAMLFYRVPQLVGGLGRAEARRLLFALDRRFFVGCGAAGELLGVLAQLAPLALEPLVLALGRGEPALGVADLAKPLVLYVR